MTKPEDKPPEKRVERRSDGGKIPAAPPVRRDIKPEKPSKRVERQG